MPDTGFLFPSSTGFSSVFGASNEYTNPTNAYADDSSYATRTDSDGSYHYQTYGNFGISLSASAVVLGIEIVRKGKSSAVVSQDSIYIYNSVANDIYGLTSGGDFFTTTESEQTTGGPTELWSGGATWNSSSLADGNFYIIHYTGGTATGRVMSLNCVKVKVYYYIPLIINVVDSISIAESKTVSPPLALFSTTVADSSSFSESITASNPLLPGSVFEPVTITDYLFDINDGVNLSRRVNEVFPITENIIKQTIIYTNGGIPRGSTPRIGN